MIPAIQVRLGDIYCTFNNNKLTAVGYVSTASDKDLPRIGLVTIYIRDFVIGGVVGHDFNQETLVHVLRNDSSLPRLNRTHTISG